MKWSEMSTKQQGLVGIGAAIAYFTSAGQTVSMPINDSQDYDMVVEIDKSLKKVQVKTTRYVKPSGAYCVTLKSSGGTAGTVYATVATGSADLMFVLTESGDKYLIPVEAFKDVAGSLTLSDKWLKFKLTS